MVDILAENLSGKAVMSSDGTELGDLYNITMNLDSGELNHLLVSPHEQLRPERVGVGRPSDGPWRLRPLPGTVRVWSTSSRRTSPGKR